MNRPNEHHFEEAYSNGESVAMLNIDLHGCVPLLWLYRIHKHLHRSIALEPRFIRMS